MIYPKRFRPRRDLQAAILETKKQKYRKNISFNDEELEEMLNQLNNAAKSARVGWAAFGMLSVMLKTRPYQLPYEELVLTAAFYRFWDDGRRQT